MPTVSNRPPVPAELGELHFLADGSVALRQGRTAVEFSFRACGLVFSAVTRASEVGPALQVTAEVGPAPYSAEGAQMREAAHAVIRASHASPSCRLMVSRQRRIYCIGRARLEGTWTPTALLAGAAELVLAVRPYLVVLRDVLPHWPKPAA